MQRVKKKILLTTLRPISQPLVIRITLGSLRVLWVPLHLGDGWFKLQNEKMKVRVKVSS